MSDLFKNTINVATIFSTYKYFVTNFETLKKFKK